MLTCNLFCCWRTVGCHLLGAGDEAADAAPGTAMLRHESARAADGAGFMAEDHSGERKLQD